MLCFHFILVCSYLYFKVQSLTNVLIDLPKNVINDILHLEIKKRLKAIFETQHNKLMDAFKKFRKHNRDEDNYMIKQAHIFQNHVIMQRKIALHYFFVALLR